MKRQQFSIIALFACILLLFMVGCNANNDPPTIVTSTTSVASSVPVSTLTPSTTPDTANTREVTDSDGTVVTVPMEGFRIASSAPAMTTAILFAGAVDKLVAICDASLNSEWLSAQFPQMLDLPVVFAANEVNTESLLKTEPDLVFYLSRYGEEAKRQLDGVEGMTVVMPGSNPEFTQMEAMVWRQFFVGSVIGGEAAQLAEEFKVYFETKLKEITDITNAIPESERPRVMDLRTLEPLVVISSEGSIQQEWIEIGGGISVGPGPGSGGTTEISIEQILQWDPEVIICDVGTYIADIKADPLWANISAVKNDQLYVMPSGSMMWGYGTPEEALMIQWIAKTLHPDSFADLDMITAAKDFYKTFLKLDLTDEEAEALFNGITVGN